jgi:hypothetical protein
MEVIVTTGTNRELVGARRLIKAFQHDPKILRFILNCNEVDKQRLIWYNSALDAAKKGEG